MKRKKYIVVDYVNGGGCELIASHRSEAIGMAAIKLRAKVDNLHIASTEEVNECFIATEIYGSKDSLEVETLRRFRNNTLSNYHLGRNFIDFYYGGAGRTVADLLKSTKFTRHVTKKCLDFLVSQIIKQEKREF